MSSNPIAFEDWENITRALLSRVGPELWAGDGSGYVRHAAIDEFIYFARRHFPAVISLTAVGQVPPRPPRRSNRHTRRRGKLWPIGLTRPEAGVKPNVKSGAAQRAA